MKILGAILAGGESRRFGGDKGAALLSGKPLIDHVADALRPQCADLAIVGRDWPGLATIADYPESGVGPLGGLCGALRHGAANGFSHILTVPCDTLPVPDDLLARLGDGGAFEGWPLLALWPTEAAKALADHLAKSGNRSVYGWLEKSGLPLIAPPDGLTNINTPADLTRL